MLLPEQFEKLGKGQYDGARRKVEVSIGAGKKTQEIIDKAIERLNRIFRKTSINESYCRNEILEVLERTSPDTIVISMNIPIDPEPVLRSRAGSDIKGAVSQSRLTEDGIEISDEFSLYIACDAFIKVLEPSLRKVGLINMTSKRLRVHHKISKDAPLVADSDEEGPKKVYSDEQGTIYTLGEEYLTGNMKLYFDNELSYKNLRNHLASEGFLVIGVNAEDEDEDDELDEQVDPTIDFDDKNEEEVSTNKEPSVLATKKSIVIDYVDKLTKALDEFEEVFKDYPDYDISELASTFSELSNKLNELGLLGKEE
jgi:hypothetical protein